MKIDKEVAANVLYEFNREGYQGGSFTQALILTIINADRHNRQLLALGYPQHVRAVELLKEDKNGLQIIRSLV